MQFQVIKKDSAEHAQFDQFLAANAGNFDYNGLAEAVNGMDIGDILSFEYRAGKTSTLREALVQRGLSSGVDFAVTGAYKGETADGKADKDSPFIVVLKRLTNKTAEKIVPKQRGRQAAAAAAGEAGAAAPAADAAAPAKPAKKK